MTNENLKIQLRGDSNNPNHLSIGAVLIENDKVAIIKKQSGIHTLPRETMFSNETLEGALLRGCEEEIGRKVDFVRYLGALVTFFDRPDNTKIEKTTIYFLANSVGDAEKNLAEDEINDQVVWLDIDSAIEQLKSKENTEYQILQKYKNQD